MRSTRRGIAVLSLLVAALALAACSGDDEPDEELASYAAGFEAARVQYTDAVVGLLVINGQSSLTDARSYFGDAVAAQERGVTALEQLDPPDSIAEPHNALLQAMRAIQDFNTQARDHVAVLSGQSELTAMAQDPDLGIVTSNALSRDFEAACARHQEAPPDESVELSCEFLRG
jgi:hypothetical protein